MIELELPTLHMNQKTIKDNLNRFNCVCCGRRFGKNILLEDIIINYLLQGKIVGHFEPTYKMVSDVWRDLVRILKPIANKIDNSAMRIEIVTGGIIDVWSLENYDSIRGRKYNLVTINEAAMFRYLKSAWQEVIRPTLTDFRGKAIFLSTPKGENYFKELFDRGNDDTFPDWSCFRYTSYENPKIDPLEIDAAKLELPDVIFRQEYLAEFVTTAGTLLKETYLKSFNINDINLNNLDIVIGVDLAISTKTNADYTAIVTVGKDKKSGNIYILDVYRDKLSMKKIMDSIVFYNNKWNPRIIGVESVQAQAYLVQELLRNNSSLNVKELKPHTDKITRFQPIQARFENGLVFIEDSIINEYKKELLAFPEGLHDDMVDATAYCYSLLDVPKPKLIIV